jgi:hypothetical protein
MMLLHPICERPAASAAELALHWAPVNRELRWAVVGMTSLPEEVSRAISPDRAETIRACGRDLFFRFTPDAPSLPPERFEEAAEAAGKWWPWPGRAGSGTRSPLGLDVPAMWGVRCAQQTLLWLLCRDPKHAADGRLMLAEQATRSLIALQRSLIGPPYGMNPRNRHDTVSRREAAWERFEKHLGRLGGGLVLMPVLTVPSAPPPRGEGLALRLVAGQAG